MGASCLAAITREKRRSVYLTEARFSTAGFFEVLGLPAACS